MKKEPNEIYYIYVFGTMENSTTEQTPAIPSLMLILANFSIGRTVFKYLLPLVLFRGETVLPGGIGLGLDAPRIIY
jgi:hypothetical protein